MLRHPDRHERLRRALAERDCDGAILVGQANAAHFAGYQRYLSGGALALVFVDGRRTLVVPRYEVAAAEESSTADDVHGYGSEDFLDFDPLPKLLDACRDRVSGRVAVAGIALEDSIRIDDVLTEIRRVKDADELERVRTSYLIALRAQQRIGELAADGATEIELFSAAQACAQDEAGAPVEFVCGISSGPNSADVAPPVHVPGRRRAQAGEPILADVAVRHNGYWGDTTRTPIVGSNPEVEEVRTGLGEVLRAAGLGLRPGTTPAAVWEEMRDRIATRFPEGRFPHHGGHGIGIAVAEDPQLIPGEPESLVAGMVFAVEPGVYFPGRYGVRVEDMYVVTEDGGVAIQDALPDLLS